MVQQVYVLSTEAVADLLELERFLVEREGSDRALTVLARLHRAMTSLSNYPGIGRHRRDLAGVPMSYAVQRWLIFYRPTADRSGIEIIRIIDGGRDIQTALDKPSRM